MKIRPRHLFTSLALLGAVGVGLVATELFAQSVPAAPVISDSPLFLTNRIKPNFIMAVDDSGSMDTELLFQSNDASLWWNVTRQSFFGLDRSNNAIAGSEIPNFNNSGDSTNALWKKYTYLFPYGSSTDGRRLGDSTNDYFVVPPTKDFAFARSSDYNAAYFNPLVTYTPWKNYDSSNYPQITPSNVPADPSRGNIRLNLTSNFSYSGTNAEFMMHKGMVIPKGTLYNVTACYNGGVDPTSLLDLLGGILTGYRSALADRTIGGGTDGRARCRVAISYFPSTFYIRNENGRPTAIANSLGYKTSAINYEAKSPGDANGNGKVDLARFEIRSENFNTGAQYTAAMQNFANWFGYYRKRSLAARAGMSQAFDGFDFINVGYFTINKLTNVTMRDMAIAADRQNIYNQILNLDPSGGTPNKDAVDYLGKQFRRTGAGAPITLSCQKNFGMLFTDGFGTPDTDASYGNVDGALAVPFKDSTSNTLADIATKHYLDNLRPDLEAGKVPVPNQCSGTAPSGKLDCRADPHMNFYGITLGSRGVLYNPDANPPQDPFANPPVWPGAYPTQSPYAVDDIWHATINTRGRFLNAKTPKEISAAIRSVLVAVQDSSLPSGRDVTSSARVGSDTFFVIPSFATRNDSTDWTGSLVAYKVKNDGTLGGLLWGNATSPDGDAAELIPRPDARKVYVVTTPGVSSTKAVKDFTSTNLGSSENARFTALGLSTTDVGLYPSLTSTQVVNYLKGDQSQEQVFDSSGVLASGMLRSRSAVLGDIIGSTPVIFSGTENFGYAGLAGTNGTSYTTFLNNRKNQKPMVYAGSNDGFLHAFDGQTGVETWAYVPNGVIAGMGKLINPQYQHKYLVDGQITVSDAQLGTGWGTALVSGLGAGGKGLFGINITSPRSAAANNLMWDLTGSAASADMGYIFSKPVIVPIRGAGNAPRWVVIFGNGYNSTNGKPALMIVDVQTGALIASIKPNVGNSNTTANGLGNVIALADADGFASTIYSGDLDGNVWKFNLSGATSSNWGVALSGSPLFTAKDANGIAQPITGGFDVAAGPNGGVMVYFGTGRYFAVNDNALTSLSSTQISSLYAVADVGVSVSGGQGALQKRSISAQSAGETDTRAIDKGIVDYDSKKGWYIDLKVAGSNAVKGERFIGMPRVEGGVVYFVTFEPIGDNCTPGGVNWLYGLDTITGSPALSNVSLPGQDSNKDGIPDQICTSGCGAVEAGSGAPVPDSVVLVPPPACVPGSKGCAAPVSCAVDPKNSACVPEGLLPGQGSYKGCTKIVSVGGKQIVQPRPCGRQSWRQVQ